MKLHIATGTLDLDRARFEPDDGAPCRLTTREVDLLGYLAGRAGEDVSRDDLLTEVWGHHELSLSRAVDTAVARLRRKIEADPRAPEALCTAHGEGYRLVLARSVHAVAAPVPARSAGVLDLGDRAVDLDAGLVHGEDAPVQLTGQERTLLLVLARRPGVVLDPDHLARKIDVTGGRSALANAVCRLRAKIEPDPSEPRFLVSVRGQGYRLDASPARRRPNLSALSHTLWTVADHLGRALGLEDCVVYAREGNALVQTAAYGTKAPTLGNIRSPITLRMDEGIVGAAARSGRVQCIHDVRADDRYVPDLHPGRSELAVPILNRDEVVGVLDSESTRVGAYDDRHQTAFTSLAAIAAAAVQDFGAALAVAC